MSPFGDYESFEDCVQKNASKDDPEAYCAAIKRQVEGKSMFGFLKSAIKALEDLLKPKQVPSEGFTIFKDNAGNLRWFGITSNHFRDHDNPPEIIETKAHEDYIAHLDSTKEYPPLLLWHTPGAELGKTDFADFDHGFLVTSGTINKDMEGAAQALKDVPLGMSHGFRFKYSEPDKRIIGWYRSFEVSVLPVEYAANPWTTVEMITKEAGMRPEKKAFLEKALGKERTDLICGSLETLQKELVGEGVEFKAQKAVEDYESYDACVSDNQDKDDPAAFCAALKKPAEEEKSAPDLVGEAVKGIMESDGMKAMLAAVEAMKQLTGQLETIKAEMKAIKDSTDQNAKDIKRSQDELVAAAFKPRSTAGVKASQSEKTLVKEGDPVKSIPAPVDQWFTESILGK